MDCCLAGAEGKEKELLFRDADVEAYPQQLAPQAKPLYQAKESSLVPDCFLTVHFLQKT